MVLPVVPEKLFYGMDAFVLVAVPMFLLAGEIFSAGRVSERLIAFADTLFGWIRGGIAQVSVGAARSRIALRPLRWLGDNVCRRKGERDETENMAPGCIARDACCGRRLRQRQD